MDKKTLTGIIIAASIVLIGGLAYAMSQQQPETVETTTTEEMSQVPTQADKMPATQTDETQTAQAATITYTNDGFTPSTLTVKKGTTITVKNESSNSVMLSSADHPTHQQQSELNMDTLMPGESGTITVTQPGSWGYHDHIDASMTGKIVVTE